MNKLAINLSPGFADDRYLEVLIVPQAVIAKVLRHLFAVRDRFSIRSELNADQISKGNAVFHVEEEFSHVRAALVWRLQLTVKPAVRAR
jgi:hypothetical protein